MNTSHIGPNQRRTLKLLQTTPAGLTRKELQQRLGIQDLRTIQRTLKTLRERGLIHIASWRYESNGRSCPACCVFMYGPGKDARKPATLGREVCRQRYREKVGRKLYNRVKEARKRGGSAIVQDGVYLWQKGKGFNRQAIAQSRNAS